MSRVVRLFFLTLAIGPVAVADGGRPPNVVIVFADDQGYADVGVFGAEGFETPNLDRMAAEGRTFTDFYAAQAVCSASRAALLTGCYPNRIGIQGVLGPNSKTGISADESTIAEVLKPLGYATAIYGKWHLGDSPRFLPTRHGFDDYFGLPYSNDMWPHHPTNPGAYPPLPLIEGEKVVEHNPDQRKPHHLVHRAGRLVHRRPQRSAVLPVRPAQHAARPAVRLREVRREVVAGVLRRRHHGDRLVGRRDPRGDRAQRAR